MPNVTKLKKDTGRLSLTQLAEELERQRKAKVDFTADTRSLEVIPHETTRIAFVVPEPGQEKVEENRVGAGLGEFVWADPGLRPYPQARVEKVRGG